MPLSTIAFILADEGPEPSTTALTADVLLNGSAHALVIAGTASPPKFTTTISFDCAYAGRQPEKLRRDAEYRQRGKERAPVEGAPFGLLPQQLQAILFECLMALHVDSSSFNAIG